ncbi:TetR/AcrR family transcriptional regulator [Piscinibacter sp. XHJ-5]|uniref:TetR/AcrR family transcriptional regulator n=1 Tax=Piscinibacter sp. XHJ-5 TaxID=3037797 RepID=UPI002452E7AE|nr:TetR/AcrR family transcriptional regulator [Piscinibacter sp. XHJ-5]
MASETSVPTHRRVRRGSAEDHDQLRQQIVAAAFAIHEREGVSALSMRALAAEMGVSPMALYRYYPSKADLLRAMWEVVLSDAQASVKAAVATQKTARARLRASIESFLRYWESHPAHFRLVYMTPETMEDRAQGAPLTGSEAYVSAVDLAGPLIDELVAEIGGRKDRALVARDLRMSLMVGYLHARIVNTRYPWSDFDALRACAVETIAAGVEACVARSPARSAKRS